MTRVEQDASSGRWYVLKGGVREHGPYLDEQAALSVSRNVTDEERFHLYRLCQCSLCDGRGKYNQAAPPPRFGRDFIRCPECRGEGRTRDLVATCGPDPEAIGTALYHLAIENEWEECPIGVLDTMPELQETDEPRKWLVCPWIASAREVRAAGRTLSQAPENKR
jgi:hypothetical protein